MRFSAPGLIPGNKPAKLGLRRGWSGWIAALGPLLMANGILGAQAGNDITLKPAPVIKYQPRQVSQEPKLLLHLTMMAVMITTRTKV